MEKRKIVFPVIALTLALCILMLPVQEAEVFISDSTEFGLEIHVEMWQYRVDGFETVYRENFPDNSVAMYKLLEYSHHAGVLTDIGADWIEDHLGDSPPTDPAKWIAVSNSASSPASDWTTIPEEVNGTGMQRAVGSYVNNGVGSWNITKSFSPSGSGSCQLTGLYWATSGHTLLCADTFTQVNHEDGDTVTIKWSIVVSGT